jgi:multicomponent K+:H+ antiporter subunit A
MGEITVLGIAAITIHALLSRFTPPPGSALSAPVASVAPGTMLQLVSRLVMPFAVLITIYLYLRGHNMPGGGFIAGLVLAIGLVLQQVAHGHAWVSQRTSADFRTWAGLGLIVAAGTGVASWLFAAPFLTSTYDYPWLPGVGGVPLASASMFDLGVYLVVVGATMVMLLAIARLTRGVAGAR